MSPGEGGLLLAAEFTAVSPMLRHTAMGVCSQVGGEEAAGQVSPGRGRWAGKRGQGREGQKPHLVQGVCLVCVLPPAALGRHPVFLFLL